MKTEKFFEAFTELDDDLVENAVPKKDTEYDVVKPALRIHSWRPIAAAAAVAAAAFGVTFAGMKLFGSGKIGTAPAHGLTDSDNTGLYQSETFNSGDFDGPKFGETIVDWVMYDSAEELVKAGDIICTGKVTDISFELLDKKTARALTDGDDPKNGELNTIYEIEVTKQYHSYREDGIRFDKLKFRVMGGLEDYKTDEQLELLKGTGDDTILVMHEPPEIKIGEEYLFILKQYDNTLPCIINAPQAAFPLSDPTYKDEFSNATVQDIIDCLESGVVDRNSVSYASKLENENPHLSAEEIVKNEDVICTGKVTNISFAVLDLDTCLPPTENSVDYKVNLFTIYDIELINSYKGTVEKNFRLVDIGGIKGYKVDEQLEALNNKYIKDKTTIAVWDDPPEINVGEEYLFIMRHSNADKPCFFSHHKQTALPLSSPYNKETYSNASVNDILNCFNAGTNDPYAEMEITHNNRTFDLANIDRNALITAVQGAMVTDCQPDYDAGAPLLEQDIEKYCKSGYVIDLVYNDIDAPLAGGGDNKKAKVIYHATVLIGGANEASYITYSYTDFSLDGASEQHDGGTYLLSSSTRDGILKILNA